MTSNIANTTTNTTISGIRLKVNEIIGVVNTLGTGEVSNSYLTSTYVTNTAFQSALVEIYASETIDYGYITSSPDLNIARDYGTL